MPKLAKGTNQTVNSIATAVGLIIAVVMGMSSADGAELTNYIGMLVGGGIGIYGLVKSYNDEKKEDKG